jgi:anti-sigma B factor antagonist
VSTRLDVTVSAGPPHAVTLVGELDIETAGRFLDAVADLTGPIDVDCTRLEFVDSTGIAAFIKAYWACQERGAQLRVRGLTGRARKPFEIAGLDAYLLHNESAA